MWSVCNHYAACASESAEAFSQALFLSPKNNVAGALAVLNAAECDVWVKPHEQPMPQLVEDALLQKFMRVLELPSVDELLDAESVEPFIYEKVFGSAANEPLCILHTSGTTGVPKPISWTHGLIATMDAVRLLPPTPGDGGLAPWTDNWNDGDTLYSAFPMSHVSRSSLMFIPLHSRTCEADLGTVYRGPGLSWIFSCRHSSTCIASWDPLVF